MRSRAMAAVVVFFLAPATASQAASSPAAGDTAQPGTLELRTTTGMTTSGKRYVLRRQRVELEGVVRPFVPGQEVTIEVLRRGRVVDRARRTIERSGDAGEFSVAFRPLGTGTYRVVGRHAPTAEQEAFRGLSEPITAITPRASRGDRGTKVTLLHRGLRRLAYVAPRGRRYSRATERAVIAFRKVNRMRLIGRATRAVYRDLFAGDGGFELERPRRGRHVEFDWSRQVLVLGARGRAQRIYHASSGTPLTPTPFGRFRFYRQDRGTNLVGMVHSSYFLRGYAIHGYRSVPTHPASHGCIRVPVPNALSIFRWIEIGQKIWIYR